MHLLKILVLFTVLTIPSFLHAQNNPVTTSSSDNMAFVYAKELAENFTLLNTNAHVRIVAVLGDTEISFKNVYTVKQEGPYLTITYKPNLRQELKAIIKAECILTIHEAGG